MHGIMFRPEMIKAIIEGRKTVTRHLRELEKINQNPDAWLVIGKAIREGVTSFRFAHQATDQIELQIKPRYQVGEVVYIKEAWAITGGRGSEHIFMPEWAARYFIRIIDVRPERLQEITEQDAVAEGMTGRLYQEAIGSLLACALDVFIWYWDSVNPKYPFSSNPFIFRYEFIKVEKK